jgi:signal transduction histidine kinase
MTAILSPWRTARTWWALVDGVLDVLVGTVSFAFVVALLATSVSLLVVLPVAVPFAWLLFVGGHGLARVERARHSAVVGLELDDPHLPLAATSWLRRILERVHTPSRWRELVYLVVLLPLGVTGVLVVALWCASAALLALPAYVGALPRGVADFGPVAAGQGIASAVTAIVGAAGLLVVAPWTTRAHAALDATVARRLLGARDRDALRAQLATAQRERAAAVDTAESERTRIERDLHDGAQQRLVTLAMDLGMAREKLDSDPETARNLVGQAHDEAKRALVELRALVRGIHPAVLTERGLDAALSSVVARASVPVQLVVDVDERPSAPIESAAYFVVTEALTNVDRHAHATRALVEVVRRDDRLVIEVTDDGAGGADEGAGSGLRGLTERVESLGGWMRVMSPAGGPTTILVELPCAS